MKTINIKGKNYIMVNERLKAFRENFKGYSLLTEIVEMTDNACTMKASILNDKREIVATGFAREVVGKTPINKFAFVENAETSAWGRALGNFGIGIDDAICTAEELNFKLEQEKEITPQVSQVAQAPKQTAEDKAGALLEIGLKLGKAETEAELIKVCKELKAKYPSQKAELVKKYNARLEEIKDLEMEKGA